MKRTLKPGTRYKTPQQKKRLSYLRDARNNYGQSDKASRRLIPKYKAWARRALRRKARLMLHHAGLFSPDPVLQGGGIEDPGSPGHFLGDWQKAEDAPLWIHVARKLLRRKALGGFRDAPDSGLDKLPEMAFLGRYQASLRHFGGDALTRELAGAHTFQP
ncbi:MAG: hypothetical protein V3S64_04635 [bacterium]